MSQALSGPEDERRLRELELKVRIHLARLLRQPAGGVVTLRVVVEGGARPRISTQSELTVGEKPLTREGP